jgi:hypothetical protein
VKVKCAFPFWGTYSIPRVECLIIPLYYLSLTFATLFRLIKCSENFCSKNKFHNNENGQVAISKHLDVNNLNTANIAFPEQK